MYKKLVQSMLFTFVILVFAVSGVVQAGEIIYTDDIKENVVDKEVLVKTADNVIVMVDSSSSMSAINKRYKKPYYDLEKDALKTGFGRLPDLGYNVGVYKFTPWEALYPVQKFDAAQAAESLNKLPAEPAGKTPLIQSLNELENVLKDLSGKTVVYIFSDGGYPRRDINIYNTTATSEPAPVPGSTEKHIKFQQSNEATGRAKETENV